MDGDLHALLSRLTDATGMDRELDCLLWCQFAKSHFEYYGGDCVIAVQGGFCGRLDWHELPHPTFSIDAADALLAGLGFTWSKYEDGRIRVADPSTNYFWWPGGATLPIRLCIGAIRCAIERDTAGGLT